MLMPVMWSRFDVHTTLTYCECRRYPTVKVCPDILGASRVVSQMSQDRKAHSRARPGSHSSWNGTGERLQ